jgi:hypothetical protein
VISWVIFWSLYSEEMHLVGTVYVIGRFIRKECLPSFGCVLLAGDGIQLRIWKSGEARGRAKVSVVIEGMYLRGLMEIDTLCLPVPRALFTDVGPEALRVALEDRRLFPRECFKYLREQLAAGGTRMNWSPDGG